MSNVKVKVIFAEEWASQHTLLAEHFRFPSLPNPSASLRLCMKVWKLRDPEKQTELSKLFKTKTQDSGLSQASTIDEDWTLLKDKLLQATKQVCCVSSNHPWKKQTWWKNNQVKEALKCGRQGIGRAACNTAKCASNHAAH